MSFHQCSGAERIDLLTPFILNLFMMENLLIKSPSLAKEELWKLIYEIKSLCLLFIYTLAYWKSS